MKYDGSICASHLTTGGWQKKNDAFMEVEPCAVIPREMFMSLKDLEV